VSGKDQVLEDALHDANSAQDMLAQAIVRLEDAGSTVCCVYLDAAFELISSWMLSLKEKEGFNAEAKLEEWELSDRDRMLESATRDRDMWRDIAKRYQDAIKDISQ
jgi:hypothetical protein